MTDLPTVSVVVPVYNAESSIDDCLRSILALEYPAERMEIVVVNNASTDGTQKLLQDYGSEIVLLHEEQRGPAAARNRGLQHARNEVIAFTDADCKVHTDWLNKLVPPLREDGVGIVGGRILSKRPCNWIEEFGERVHDHDKAINVFKPAYVITMNWAMRREVLDRVGYFDVKFVRCEDVDLSRRVLQAGYRFFYAPEAIVYHKNEDTLRGLFHEGYLHGYWAVQASKAHAGFLGQFGRRRFNWHSYARILKSFKDTLLGPERSTPMCDFVFNTGKKVGKLAGSVRFRHLDL